MLLSSIEVCSWWCSCLFSSIYIGDDTQQHLKSITLKRVTLDVVCDVVASFEHMKELQCMKITEPQEVWLLYSYMCMFHLLVVLNIYLSLPK